MNVLQVLPFISSRSGGPVRSTLASCAAVRRVDPAIHFSVIATKERSAVTIPEGYIPADVEVTLFPVVGTSAFAFSPHMLRWLRANVSRFDVAVVRTLLNPISSGAAWACREAGVPYVVVPHGTLSRYTFRYRRRWLKRLYAGIVDRRTLEGAAAIQFTSSAEREEARAFAADLPSRVIPHPYEPSSEIHHGHRKRQILFLSRFHEKKGIEVLLDAFGDVRGRLPGTRLVLAGSGARRYERLVRSLVRRRNLADDVDLPGFVEGEAKSRLLAESEVLVLASEHENFGIAVVEAMNAGLPVIVSKGVDIWPLVQEAKAGLVLETRTPEVLAAALLRLLQDARLRQRLGLNGREAIRSYFCPETIGMQLRDLYRQVAGVS